MTSELQSKRNARRYVSVEGQSRGRCVRWLPQVRSALKKANESKACGRESRSVFAPCWAPRIRDSSSQSGGRVPAACTARRCLLAAFGRRRWAGRLDGAANWRSLSLCLQRSLLHLLQTRSGEVKQPGSARWPDRRLLLFANALASTSDDMTLARSDCS